MGDITVLDYCAHCHEQFQIPVSIVTVLYHRTDCERDRYQWQHDGCPMTIHPYDDTVRGLLRPVADAGKLIAQMIDEEYDDPARDWPEPIGEDEILTLCRQLYDADAGG